MSLGIVFKGTEGIVLAADSRVTLEYHTNLAQNKMLVHQSTFDNATKLLQVNGQEYIGAVTYGLAALGGNEPRTAHSLIPEFEAKIGGFSADRMNVEQFSVELSAFFMEQWKIYMPTSYQGSPMIFLVGGYDEDAPYGHIYEFSIPNIPKPKELNPKKFGITLGGQNEYVTRILRGFDPSIGLHLKDKLGLKSEQVPEIIEYLTNKLALRIPYEFLPLQDCVDLCIFLIKATIQMQQLAIGIRGVGGAIDVAIITKQEGFTPIQEKSIAGERKLD